MQTLQTDDETNPICIHLLLRGSCISGIYYRVQRFRFDDHPSGIPFEAPSGYECDASYFNPDGEGKNYWGSLGDWYVRPSLRIYADQAVLAKTCIPGEWNRMTIRARSNRLEYCINGIKVMDFVDPDPKGSREGVIGLQIHGGSVMKIEFRNIHVLPLTL